MAEQLVQQWTNGRAVVQQWTNGRAVSTTTDQRQSCQFNNGPKGRAVTVVQQWTKGQSGYGSSTMDQWQGGQFTNRSTNGRRLVQQRANGIARLIQQWANTVGGMIAQEVTVSCGTVHVISHPWLMKNSSFLLKDTVRKKNCDFRTKTSSDFCGYKSSRIFTKFAKYHEQFIQTHRFLWFLKTTYLHGSEKGVVGGLNARWRGLGEVHHGGEGSRRQGTRTEIPKAKTGKKSIN
jgi:hypothetical protein